MMDSVEEYAKICVTREEVKLDTLSEWVKSIRSWLKPRRIRFTNWNFVRMLYTNQYLRIKRQISVCQYVVVPADKLLLTLFLFVENYYYGCLIKELFTRTLVIIPTKVLILTKKNYWQISIHSCCQWIFRLARSMVTSLLYIEYQNFTRIQREKAILLVLLLVQQKNCL